MRDKIVILLMSNGTKLFTLAMKRNNWWLEKIAIVIQNFAMWLCIHNWRELGTYKRIHNEIEECTVCGMGRLGMYASDDFMKKLGIR